MSHKCTGILGAIFGHKFRIQTVYGAPDISGMRRFSGEVSALEVLRPVHSVVVMCERCGISPSEEPK